MDELNGLPSTTVLSPCATEKVNQKEPSILSIAAILTFADRLDGRLGTRALSIASHAKYKRCPLQPFQQGTPLFNGSV
jgi:hypothetical protein